MEVRILRGAPRVCTSPKHSVDHMAVFIIRHTQALPAMPCHVAALPDEGVSEAPRSGTIVAAPSSISRNLALRVGQTESPKSRAPYHINPVTALSNVTSYKCTSPAQQLGAPTHAHSQGSHHVVSAGQGRLDTKRLWESL